MPRPVRSDQKYLPGLDGLRALAVTAVIAYHLGYGWAQGGLLGVGVFFTLSGYLITDILVGQFAASGRVKLGDFWMRRARRLLPALFLMIAVVTVWVNAFNRAFVPGYRGDVIASGLYVNNWWYIFQHDSYYSRFAPPAPLDHLWSLAVEEQFYLVWPWAVLAMVLLAGWLAKRRRVRLLGPGTHVGGTADGAAAAVSTWGASTRAATTRAATTRAAATGQAGGNDFLSGRARWAMAGVALVLATASAIEMAMLFHPGYDPTRVYEGTDTRAFGLLIGAAVAMVYPTRRGARTLSAGSRRLLDAAGLAGLVVVVLLVWRTNEYSDFMFRGGLELLSVATALVVAAAATPGGLLGRALGWTPMRWIGVRSYGIYLWHYPIIVLTAAAGTAGTPVSAVRAVVLVAATVIIAALSWRFVEDPIRRGSYRRTAPAAAPATATVASANGGAARAVGGGHVELVGGTPAGGATADGATAGGVTAAGVGGTRGAVASDGGAAGHGGTRQTAGAGGRAGGRRPLRVLTSPLAIGGLCLLATAGITAGVTSANSGQASNTADTSAAGTTGTTGTGGAGGAALAQSAAAGAASANQGGASGTSGSASMTSAAHNQGKNGAADKVAVTSSGSGGSSSGQPTGGYMIQPVVGGPPTTLATGAATVAALPTPPPRTSCTSVVHIGDSTSDGLFSSDYLPDKSRQIPAQYADVGVKTTIDRVVGATSVVESLPGTQNAQTMATGEIKSGYHGCWVIALGTNDTADVAVGSEVSRAQRIKTMMAIIGNQPVMWVEVKSILSSGPYSEPNMELWDQALQQALPSYPNMRLYNWPAVVQHSWFINDGIHYTSDGYAHRGQMIAEALAEAFPAN
ncbi:MAG TPA: acyltransferase family protein [Trebonia sp.]